MVWVVALLWPGVGAAQSVSGSSPSGGAPFVLPEITVVAPTPLRGDQINRAKIPAMVQTLTAEDFVRTHEGAWRRVARARAQVPRSAARRVPVCGWAA